MIKGKKYFNRFHHLILWFVEEDEDYLYFIDVCDVKYKYKKGFIEQFLEEYEERGKDERNSC